MTTALSEAELRAARRAYHGTGEQAIEWAVKFNTDGQEDSFLRAWQEGDLDEWPDYYEWLDNQSAQSEATPSPDDGRVEDFRDRIAMAILGFFDDVAAFRAWAAHHSTYPNAFKSLVDQCYMQADRVIAALQPQPPAAPAASAEALSEALEPLPDDLARVAAIGWIDNNFGTLSGKPNATERLIACYVAGLQTSWGNVREALAAATPAVPQQAEPQPPASDAGEWVLVPREQLREWYSQMFAFWVSLISDDADDDGGPTPQAMREMEAMLTGSNPAPAKGVGADVEQVVEAARRDIARTQTDFLGRMGEALCEYEAAFDEYPDGDLPDTYREIAEENIAALAGLALAQLVMLRHPSDPLAALTAPPQLASTDERVRRCTVCTATVASYPEGMCCHCRELPWPIAPTPEASDMGRDG